MGKGLVKRGKREERKGTKYDRAYCVHKHTKFLRIKRSYMQIIKIKSSEWLGPCQRRGKDRKMKSEAQHRMPHDVGSRDCTICNEL